MKRFLKILGTISLSTILLISTSSAWAASTNDWGGSDTSLADAQTALASYDYATARDILIPAVADAPFDADKWNLLGYAQRKLGAMDASFEAYQKALNINPNHLGANEYLGEWYVMKDDRDNAIALLNKLKGLCPSGCEEADDLEEAICLSAGGCAE